MMQRSSCGGPRIHAIINQHTIIHHGVVQQQAQTLWLQQQDSMLLILRNKYEKILWSGRHDHRRTRCVSDAESWAKLAFNFNGLINAIWKTIASCQLHMSFVSTLFLSHIRCFTAGYKPGNPGFYQLFSLPVSRTFTCTKITLPVVLEPFRCPGSPLTRTSDQTGIGQHERRHKPWSLSPRESIHPSFVPALFTLGSQGSAGGAYPSFQEARGGNILDRSSAYHRAHVRVSHLNCCATQLTAWIHSGLCI